MIEIKHRFTEDVLYAVPADSLVEANLAGAALHTANFVGLDLHRTNLQGAALAVADFSGANLSGCNLRNADLTGAVLTGAKLSGADLRGATFTHTDLGHSGLEDSNLTGVNLNDANLTGADLSRARLQGTNLADASMKYTLLAGAAFDDRTQFPALIFDPEAKGAVRAAGGATSEPDLQESAAWDAGEPVVECLFQRASDAATLSLHVRTASEWLIVDRPTEALAGQLQQALNSAGSEARAYRVGSAWGLLVRARRC